MVSDALKTTNYRCVPAIQPFYTGGPFAISTNGFFIACACGDSIIIFDIYKDSIISTLKWEDHNERVVDLVFDTKDKILFSSHSSKIRVWNLSMFTYKSVSSWQVPEGSVVKCMACHPNGDLLASGGDQGKILVWDVNLGSFISFIHASGKVVSRVMFHPDPEKNLLFSVCDATVEVSDLSNTAENYFIATLDMRSEVTSIAVSEDGWTLLSAARDKTVKLWDLHDYSTNRTVITDNAVEAVCVIASRSPFASSLESYQQDSNILEGFYFVTVDEQGYVCIRSTSEGSNIALCFSLKCTEDLVYGDLIKSLELDLTKKLVGYIDVVDVKFVNDEEELITLVTGLGKVCLYDIRKSYSKDFGFDETVPGFDETVLCLDTCIQSSSQTLIAIGCESNTVMLWDFNNNPIEYPSCIGVGKCHEGPVRAIAFSKSKKNQDIFFVSGSSDHTLKVWSKIDGLDELKETASIVAHHQEIITSVAVERNDAFVCSGSQNYNTAIVRNLPDLNLKVELKGHDSGIWSVEFSPVDTSVVTASGDKTIRIWDISDGSCLKKFEEHTYGVLRALFVTRGTQIVSCGADGLIKLWTVEPEKCVATYYDHLKDKVPVEVRALAVGRKTEMLATGDSTGVVNLWNDSSAVNKELFFKVIGQGVRRWEDMNEHILVSIFLLLDISDVTEGIAHVCSKWRSVCRNPTLWKTINLSTLTSHSEREIRRVAKILRISLRFGRKQTKILIFPFNFPLSDKLLLHAAQSTPDLEKLVLPNSGEIRDALVTAASCDWKKLKSLIIPGSMLVPSLKEISNNSILELKIYTGGFFYDNQAELVCKLFPKLEVLSITPSVIYEEAILVLLNRLRELKVFNLSHCYLRNDFTHDPYRMTKTIFEKTCQLEKILTHIDEPEDCYICGLVKNQSTDTIAESVWRTDKIQTLEI